MDAGESAREVARRSRERRGDTAWSRRWDQGADGEVETGAALTELPAAEWTVLHDVVWPGRRRANLDHVVVGPGGVFVIDSKLWSGTVTCRGGMLRQGSRRRDRAVSGAVAQADSVRGLLRDLDPRAVVPVLCLARQGGIEGRAGEVLVTAPANVVRVLRGHPPLLSDGESRRVAGRLALSLPRVVAPSGAARLRSRVPRRPDPGPGTRPPRLADGGPRRWSWRWSWRPWVAALLLLLLLAGGALHPALAELARVAADRAAAWVVATAAPQRAAAPATAFGGSHRVGASASAPALEITVGQVSAARPRSGSAPPGSRWWAAYVVVRNAGDRPLDRPRALVPRLVGSDGTERPARAGDRVRRGAPLSLGRPLRPGAVREGYAAWLLPRGVRPAEVVLGEGDATRTWSRPDRP
ncbi:Nuclease-related domain-containing protein [Nocardioides scoriae]|uniref:Nuclease-related domain-containing protein n=1 Tax=Nocardioides scoriae TaxID=642780 RepID=A0A1H1RHD4_9ACTN|nr:NERD domain-containing protein [Nocardioides scoriae]SDS35105.1 Nuclease-related domain-containing protein [Nocardioides scoriae]